MRIAVLGSGAVGGYFGGRLAAAGADVTLVARGAHLAALRERGLRILSPHGDINLPQIRVTDDPTTIGPVDIVFFTVKLYDTEGALAMLPALIGPGTLVIPFQNGVESVETLSRAVGRSHVAGGTAYVAAVVSEPGVVRHSAMGSVIFGALDGGRPALLEQLLHSCKKAGFEASLSERIAVEIWAKFARLTVFSGITAVTRCAIGVVRADSDLVGLMQAALHESISVARGKQIPLPETLYDATLSSMAALPANAKSSMLEDLERGRPLELPWLSGAIVRIGNDVGVPTPIHRLFVTLLKPHVRGSLRPHAAASTLQHQTS
jgi:2-dehydropantoate 2-reductase